MAKQKVTNSQLNLEQGVGYLKIGSIIIQWGAITTNSVAAPAYSETSSTLTFPVTFSTAPSVTVTASDFNNACGEYVSYDNLTASSVRFWVGHSGASTAATNVLRWIAIGAA